MADQNSLEPELFLALVTPVGVRRHDLIAKLNQALREVGYQPAHLRLSPLLERSSVWTESGSTKEAERVKHLQEMGNKFRERLRDGAAIARASIVAIREARISMTKDPEMPGGRIAYILDQLKHPAEVDFLRDVYGSCAYVISAHAPKRLREDELGMQIAKDNERPGESGLFRAQVDELISNDDVQEGEYGQNTRDTYPKADFFVDMSVRGGEHHIDRFIELLFANPFHTPTQEEYAMYQAGAAALRSSDDSRQVGAAIATGDGNVVAVGTNEVPRRGGGLYWPGQSPDARDQALLANQGEDRAEEIKVRALAELLERLKAQHLIVEGGNAKARDLLPALKGTQFMNIGEFGRTVHAEMAALIDAARRGVGVDKHTMFVTAFPCHNCAKHIIAAGIEKVIYLEPYPKSRAEFLHREELELDPIDRNFHGKVGFLPFSGIAPRQYHQLFAMAARGAKKGHPLKDWNSKRATLPLRYVARNAPYAYLAAEREELEKLRASDFTWDKSRLCPSRT